MRPDLPPTTDPNILKIRRSRARKTGSYANYKQVVEIVQSFPNMLEAERFWEACKPYGAPLASAGIETVQYTRPEHGPISCDLEVLKLVAFRRQFDTVEALDQFCAGAETHPADLDSPGRYVITNTVRVEPER